MANNLAHVIAVTGLAGHFPGATAIESIRHDLGGDAPPPEPGQPGPAAGSGLEPGSAGRRFADSARLAIQHAACAGRSETERTGLFVGVYGEARYDAAVDGGDGDRLAAEVAGELGLRGPAATVVDPSSPALAAVDRAAESLRRAECDLALAGEVASGGGEVPAGDAAAAHAGALVLRRLSDALVDGDRVLAVLRGSAVHGAGFEAPPAPAPRLRHEGGEEIDRKSVV